MVALTYEEFVNQIKVYLEPNTSKFFDEYAADYEGEILKMISLPYNEAMEEIDKIFSKIATDRKNYEKMPPQVKELKKRTAPANKENCAKRRSMATSLGAKILEIDKKLGDFFYSNMKTYGSLIGTIAYLDSKNERKKAESRCDELLDRLAKDQAKEAAAEKEKTYK